MNTQQIASLLVFGRYAQGYNGISGTSPFFVHWLSSSQDNLARPTPVQKSHTELEAGQRTSLMPRGDVRVHIGASRRDKACIGVQSEGKKTETPEA
ncbi:hypothetical protein CYLTODRAFT_420089 [Cylindrobasidium torrendii FP15055 ss-10]|uniref:Uncharacterized protein n=1 Tax=Cylindrobasidium torrendii FP15055 ss-10 TaxID=1314674 RepID=A0A0D7BKH1_9AGAR|nr:hypothetical protein CYLTODRAFT_420089 [Cylindrobasidium torrendii FP15055 ss-10]